MRINGTQKEEKEKGKTVGLKGKKNRKGVLFSTIEYNSTTASTFYFYTIMSTSHFYNSDRFL